MNKLIFYNNHNNGDIHYVREFIKDIINKTSFDEYHFLHMRNPKILGDIQNLNNGPLNEFCRMNSHFHVINNDTYVNTHLEGLHDIMYEKIKDVDLPVFYNYFINIYNKLKIKIESNRDFYVPDIDYSCFKINKIDEYISKNSNIKILISNGNVQSNQSPNFDFVNIIEDLSNEYPDIHFILTDKKDILKKDNVLYTSDIINELFDLNEISYLSTFCQMIIGRSSGPYCFTQVKQNLNNSDKIYIFIGNNYSDGIWYERNLCTKIWINQFSLEHIINILKEHIKKLNNYSSLFNVRTENNKIIIDPLETIDNIRIDFYNGDNIMYKYKANFIKGIYHWIIPHGHYTSKMKVKCKFFKEDINEYLFEKIV